MTTETTNAPVEPAPEQSTRELGGRWLTTLPEDWPGWLAFQREACSSLEARDSLRDWILRLDPDSNAARLGLAFYAAGDLPAAAPHLARGGSDLCKLLAANAHAACGRRAAATDLLRALAGSKAVGRQARLALLDLAFVQRDASALAAAQALAKDEAERAFAEGLGAELEAEHEAAITALQRAVAADPSLPEPTFRLAEMLELRGADEDAIDFYERFRLGDLPPHAGALMNLGVLHMDREEPRWAVTCFRLVVEAEPTNERARKYLRDARASLEQYYDESRERKADKQSAILRTPVTDFELSVRARNCLQRMNIHTLGDLVQRSEPELLAFKNFGETSLQEVKDILVMKGLKLGMVLGEPAPGEPPAPPTAGPPDLDPMEMNVSDLDLSVRSRAALATLGITKVKDLIATTETTLLSCKNFGQTSLDEIKSKLRNFGLALTA